MAVSEWTHHWSLDQDVYKSKEQLLHEKLDFDELETRRRVAKEIIQGTLSTLQPLLIGVPPASLDLHDCYLGTFEWPVAARWSVDFHGAYIDSKSVQSYKRIRFNPTTALSFTHAFVTTEESKPGNIYKFA